MDYSGKYEVVNLKKDTLIIPKTDGFYQYEKALSQHPAYHFRLSTRDLALYGQLYLNQGKWKGKTIVPSDWISTSTKAYSVTYQPAGLGYGMLWKVLMPTKNRKSKSFYHTGLGVHMLAVYPAARMVLVHRVDTEKEFDFNERKLRKVIGLVWAAKED
jgi:CubicO group peptidase (beta-lactamase class C family)